MHEQEQCSSVDLHSSHLAPVSHWPLPAPSAGPWQHLEAPERCWSFGVELVGVGSPGWRRVHEQRQYFSVDLHSSHLAPVNHWPLPAPSAGSPGSCGWGKWAWGAQSGGGCTIKGSAPHRSAQQPLDSEWNSGRCHIHGDGLWQHLPMRVVWELWGRACRRWWARLPDGARIDATALCGSSQRPRDRANPTQRRHKRERVSIVVIRNRLFGAHDLC